MDPFTRGASAPLPPRPHDPQAVPRPALPSARELVEAFRARRKLGDLQAAAAHHVAELVGARTAHVWVRRSLGGWLAAAACPGCDGPDPADLRLGRGEGLAGWVVERGQPLRLGPGDPRPEIEGPLPEFRSAMVVPLFRRGAAFAAVECLDKLDAPVFGDDDLERVQAAAEPITLALDNALLDLEAERRELEKDVLLAVGKTLSAPLELDEVLDAILRSLGEAVRYDAASIYLVDRATGSLEPVRSVGYPAGSDEAFRLQVGQGIVGWVAKTGTGVLVPDTSRDRRYVNARPTTCSELAAPLVLEGETVGVFNLESDRPDAYHEEHLELLAGLAVQAALAIERARALRERMERRHLERELAIARAIQDSFLPKSAPVLEHFDIAGMTRPHADVGGDYYDFIRVGENRLGIAIADVSGKGIPAALIMASFRASLLAEIRNEFAIRAVMAKANSLLLESRDPGKFVTCFYGLLDFKYRALTFCNAGHNPPLLRRADGRLECLGEGGVALGIVPAARYEDRPLTLHPGDILLLYTDGVTESLNAMKETFGQPRLEQALERLHDRPAQEILEGVVQAALDWSGEEGQSDDLTVVVVKAKP
jgi:serine phosphatase RsbU (regulator of sigma subunit)